MRVFKASRHFGLPHTTSETYVKQRRAKDGCLDYTARTLGRRELSHSEGRPAPTEEDCPSTMLGRKESFHQKRGSRQTVAQTFSRTPLGSSVRCTASSYVSGSCQIIYQRKREQVYRSFDTRVKENKIPTRIDRAIAMKLEYVLYDASTQNWSQRNARRQWPPSHLQSADGVGDLEPPLFVLPRTYMHVELTGGTPPWPAYACHRDGSGPTAFSGALFQSQNRPFLKECS